MNIQSLPLVVCADDFGMASEIDESVMHLAELGRINATSCVTQGPSFSQNARAVRKLPLQLGLHLNLTEKMGTEGLYTAFNKLAALAWLRRLNPVLITEQIKCQLDTFEDVMAQRPDFVDGHQHIHQFPVIRDCLIRELLHRYGANLPWLRSTLSVEMPGLPRRAQHKAKLIAAMGAKDLNNLIHLHGFKRNRHFLGVYDFKGGVPNYSFYMRQWLKLARNGDLLICHPALGSINSDRINQQRFAEYQVLAGEEMGQLLLRVQQTHSLFVSKRHMVPNRGNVMYSTGPAGLCHSGWLLN